MKRQNIKELKSIQGLSKHLKKHFHEEYTICFILKGLCQAWVNGTTIDLKANDLLLIPGYVVHSCIPQGGNDLFFKVISIEHDWLSVFFRDKKLYSAFISNPSILINNSNHVSFPVKELTVEKKSVEFEYKLADLLVSVSDSIKSERVESHRGRTKDLEYVKDYLTANYERDISLDDISGFAGLSKYYLIEKFKKQFQLTPYAYLLNLKVNAAKQLLNRDRSLTDIALDLGFYDQSHFSNVFVQYVGLTPQSYRNLTR